MTSRLVIGESPAKAKTIKKYLGAGYTVMASYGHVRDLIPKEGAVDPENNFEMVYEVIAKNARHVKAMTDALKDNDELLLATDPDREGVAIAFHIQEIVPQKRGLKKKPIARISFNEFTKPAILEAMKHPKALAMDMVNAQQAR